MSGLPLIMKKFVLHVNGENYAGEVSKVDTPKLERKMEKHRSGSMIGEIDIDLGLEPMELSYTAAGFVHQAVKDFGAQTVDAVSLRLNGAIQREDTGEVQAVEIIARGRYKTIEFGSFEAGSKNETTVTLPITYYKLTVNGSVIAEVDMVNMIEIYNGVDTLSAIRLALGLTSLIA